LNLPEKLGRFSGGFKFKCRVEEWCGEVLGEAIAETSPFGVLVPE
jgi:hypothetical protein